MFKFGLAVTQWIMCQSNVILLLMQPFRQITTGPCSPVRHKLLLWFEKSILATNGQQTKQMFRKKYYIFRCCLVYYTNLYIKLLLADNK